MPPAGFNIAYHGPADAEVPALMKTSAALVIPAVGPKLAPALFEGTSLKLVQVTGAGVDRLDQAALTKLGIPVANVAGGSNSAVAEYAVTAASTLLRRMAWSDAEIKNGNLNLSIKRAEMVANALIRYGVPSDAIVMEGVSDEEPVYETRTARGIAANRRAEVFIDF